MAGFQRLRSAALVTAAIADLSCEATSTSIEAVSPQVTTAASLRCLGVARPLTLSRGLPYVDVVLGANAEPASFLLDYATNRSTFDPSGISTTCSRRGPCSFANVSFLGLTYPDVALGSARHLQPQAGIVGTDLTRRVALALDYEHETVRHASEASFCAESELRAAGLSPLPTTGFFTNDLSKLRPLADVVAGAARGVVANVPTVPLRIAGVTAHAQLDTGFEDSLVPFSVNVNASLFDRLMAARPEALTRAPERDVTLTTCVGGSEPVEAYTLASDAAVDFIGESGEPTRSFRSVTLFVKRTPKAARACGGIGTWTAPAAQVAASFYAAFGLVIFDPFASRVWIRSAS